MEFGLHTHKRKETFTLPKHSSFQFSFEDSFVNKLLPIIGFILLVVWKPEVKRPL